MTVTDFLQQVKKNKVSFSSETASNAVISVQECVHDDFLPLHGFCFDDCTVLLIETDALDADQAIFMTEFCKVKGCGLRRYAESIHEKRKKEILCSDFLISVVFSALEDQTETRLYRTDFGKPYFCGPGTLPFSVTHTDSLAVLVFTEQTDCLFLGADLEKIRPINEMVLAKICTEDELIQIDSIYTSDERNEFGTRLWTRKEAVVKALGLGISALSPAISVMRNRLSVKGYRLELNTISVSCNNNSYILSVAAGIS